MVDSDAFGHPVWNPLLPLQRVLAPMGVVPNGSQLLGGPHGETQPLLSLPHSNAFGSLQPRTCIQNPRAAPAAGELDIWFLQGFDFPAIYVGAQEHHAGVFCHSRRGDAEGEGGGVGESSEILLETAWSSQLGYNYQCVISNR